MDESFVFAAFCFSKLRCKCAFFKNWNHLCFIFNYNLNVVHSWCKRNCKIDYVCFVCFFEQISHRNWWNYVSDQIRRVTCYYHWLSINRWLNTCCHFDESKILLDYNYQLIENGIIESKYGSSFKYIAW